MRFKSLSLVVPALLAAVSLSAPARGQITDAQAVAVRASLDSIDANTAKVRALVAASPVPTAVTTPRDTAPAAVVPVLFDDFTKYGDTKSFLANVANYVGGTGSGSSLYNDGYYGALLELDRTVLYNGHATVKYNQPSGTSATPQLWASIRSGALTKAWIRIKVRYSPGFTTKGTTANSANAYKLLGWGWSGTDGRGTIEFTNTTQYTFNWNVVTSDNSRTGPVVEKNSPNVVTEWSDGSWYDYIVFVEQKSSSSVRQRWWMAKDGSTPQLKADITGTMSKGSAPALDRVMLGMNFNSSRTQSQALWYGEWCVVDGAKYPNPFNVAGL